MTLILTWNESLHQTRYGTDISIVNPAGFTLTNGLSTTTPELAPICAAMLRSSRHRVAPIASNHIGHDAAFHYAAAEDINLLVGDAPITQTTLGQHNRPFEYRASSETVSVGTT